MNDQEAVEPAGPGREPASESSVQDRAASTLGAARRRLAARLRAGGSESAGLDARLLVEGATGRSHLDPVAPLDPAAAMVLDGYAERRLAGEPVWRILGEREFWGLRFRLSPATLEPRPDTETLVEATIDILKERRNEPLSILDLGTGTGCLLIATLSEFRQARGLGIDLSQEACATAAGNAALNGLAGRATFRQGNWTQGIEERFDLILSNPPYIRNDEIAGLAPEVRDFDPRLALDGGADGLDPYRDFAVNLPHLLTPEGVIVLEIGAGQGSDVVALMQQAGLAHLGTRHDLGGHARALIFAGRG
ncbi:peptide chain release factor N(5)-glutamine methyltransferase [Bosea sp. BK604]|uniref:peptide chain release factor N(5)-glutamine methyltransferase n=1 Tax=Bosea sp. BK604 TaxID=2512180 RepID=UPI00104EAEFD|nr:peptide chain release factor N(5)-glutamine methyltransferase [Bosea sp. BK604]TCR60895.1 release factor glutamine methyltransferase [Bosea sp. BK604]